MMIDLDWESALQGKGFSNFPNFLDIRKINKSLGFLVFFLVGAVGGQGSLKEISLSLRNGLQPVSQPARLGISSPE